MPASAPATSRGGRAGRGFGGPSSSAPWRSPCGRRVAPSAVDSALHQALKDALEAGLGAQPEAGPEVDPLRALLAGCALFTIHGENEDAVAQKAISRADKMLFLMRRNKTT